MHKLIKYIVFFVIILTALLTILTVYAEIDLTIIIFIFAIFGGPLLAIAAVSVLSAGAVKNIKVINNPNVSDAQKNGMRRRFFIVLAWILIPIILYWVVFGIFLLFE